MTMRTRALAGTFLFAATLFVMIQFPVASGWQPEGHSHPGQHPQPHDAKARPPVVLSCPMHPEVHLPKAGNCPKCPMVLGPAPAAAATGLPVFPPDDAGAPLTLEDLQRMALKQHPAMARVRAIVDAATGCAQ